MMRKISVNGYPPFPNGGKMFQTWDGEWFNAAFFHIDPETGEKWWEDAYTKTLKNVTHWGELPYDEIDDKIVLDSENPNTVVKEHFIMHKNNIDLVYELRDGTYIRRAHLGFLKISKEEFQECSKFKLANPPGFKHKI